MATLTIKNESGARIEFVAPGGPVRLDAGAIADLSGEQLGSQGFADAVQSGKVTFVAVPQPTKEQVELAKAVLPRLVAGAEAKLTQSKARFDQSQKELKLLRQTYNKMWKTAEIHFAASREVAAGWPGLRKAIKNLIFDTQVEDAAVEQKKQVVARLEDELKALKEPAADLVPKDGPALDKWFMARLAKEQAVKEAREAWEKVRREKTNPLLVQVDALEVSFGELQAVGTKDKSIGKEIAEFGR